MKRTKEIRITFFAANQDAYLYALAYIHQQLKGNPNYINNNIIIDMDRENNKNTIYICIDNTMDMDHIPNIAIDWKGIRRIIISNLDETTKTNIIKSIEDSYYDYPNDDKFDMAINDLHLGKIIITANGPHIVFNLHDWIIGS